MNLFVWIGENGEWVISHLPPPGHVATLQISVASGPPPFFIDLRTLEEVEVQLTPRSR